VDDLAEEDRRAYLALAVVPERTSIPEAALKTIWDADASRVRRTVSALVKRSLAVRDTADTRARQIDGIATARIRLHDLQLQYVKQKAPETDRLHEALLQRYAHACEGGWHTGPDDGYFFQRLAYHLDKARRSDELKSLLLDFRWLERKLDRTSVNRLLADFDLLGDAALAGWGEGSLVRDAIRLAAHAVAGDVSQLPAQIVGRLMERPEAPIRALCAEAAAGARRPWLRPVNARLAVPGSSLVATLSGHSNGVNAVAVRQTKDGTAGIAMSGSDDRTVIVWDLRYGDILRPLVGHSEHVVGVSLAPMGSLGISCAYDGETIVWDVDAGSRLRSLPGPEGGYCALSILSDGRSAVTVAWDGTIAGWNLATGDRLRQVSKPLADVTAAAVAVGVGLVLLGCDDGRLLVRDARGDRPDRTLPMPGDVVSLAVTPDGTRALCVSLARKPALVVFDLAAGHVMYERPFPFRYGVRAVGSAISRDGRRALTAFNDGLLTWDLDAGLITRHLQSDTPRIAVAILPDGRHAVTASDHWVRFWNLDGRGDAFQDHAGRVIAVSFLTDGRAVSLCESDAAPATLATLDVPSGRQVTSEEVTVTNQERALLPDGQQVILTEGANVSVADLRTEAILLTLSGHSDTVKEVSITPDGRQAVSVSNNGEVIGWDLEYGHARWTVRAPHGENSVAVLVPGSDLLLQGGYGRLTLWDPCTGGARRMLQEHTDFVRSIAVTPDGRLAVSAGQDGLLVLWDLGTAAVRARYVGDVPFSACAIAADGTHVAAGDESGRVHLLRLE
jgi:WD40 repeat protein